MNSNFQKQTNCPANLSQLSLGDSGIISGLICKGALRRRLMDLGFIAGATVSCVGISPHKDPKAYRIRGAIIALRAADSRSILLKTENPRQASLPDPPPPKPKNFFPARHSRRPAS